MSHLRQELIELLLALIQLSTADIVHTEESHDAVNNEKTVLVADEVFGDFVEELHLVFGVDGTGVGDVLLGYRSQRDET